MAARKGFAPDAGKKPEPSSRMVVYVARYHLQVDSVESSVASIRSMATEYNGFLEKVMTSDAYRAAYLVIRVPVADFEKVLKKLEGIGEVLKRSVSASDVTKEYNDTGLRLKMARRVRARLYELLKRVRKVKEKIRILEEIDRLTQKIDRLVNRRAFLKNRASFSTIFVRLTARVRQSASRPVVSPFAWIAGLSMERRSIFESSSIEYGIPSGYFSQEKDFKKRRKGFLFTSPAGGRAGIRIGTVPNEPLAGLDFWEKAFSRDLLERKQQVIKKNRLVEGGREYSSFEINRGDSVYLVAFAVCSKKLLVIEACFQDRESYSAYGKSIDAFIKSVRVD